MIELAEPDWHPRRDAHEARVDALAAGHLARRSRHEKHPVEDFMWTYYSHRPAALRRWDPGAGVMLHGDVSCFVGRAGYVVDETHGLAYVDPSLDERRVRQVWRIHRLLSAIQSRPPQLGCFGLHEWAMVYHLGQSQVRHASWPLRLGHEDTDAVVDSHRIACSHFDAFRFFTGDARPLNTIQPTRERQVELDQPGCLHATMDCYKWAYKLKPLVPSELVADCFELARDVRELDMRAAPYDLRDLGYEPVRIETPQGKQEYTRAQRAFADRAAPLRGRLIEATEALLSRA